MALATSINQSPSTSIASAFSPYSDSPTSPQRFDSPVHRPIPQDLSSHTHLPTQPSPLAANSPTADIADPSPIATSSSGTDTTDIDDATYEQSENEITGTVNDLRKASKPPLGLETKRAAAEAAMKSRSDDDEQPSSVIHAPQGFEAFHRQVLSEKRKSASASAAHLVSPSLGASSAERTGIDKDSPSRFPVSPPLLQTSIPPARDWSATPRAQTRLEVEQSLEGERQKGPSRSSSRSSILADIPEGNDGEDRANYSSSTLASRFEDAAERLHEQDDNVAALKHALRECWTLCNTLASLSHMHREKRAGKSREKWQDQAWKSCWNLCSTLYETRDEETGIQIRPILDLCREFCQSLFEVRKKENSTADSVLRVSFELNNHLYNTHDRSLPEAFRERTLDFYIVLCHRLMKQRVQTGKEADMLLAACWSLTEMLFTLRQSRREGHQPDAEMLGSAVQACWDLCDLFREGWTQVRPERGTPRPSQTTFAQAFHQAKRLQATTPSTIASSSAEAYAYWANVAQADDSEEEDPGRHNPETPTTVFDDMQLESSDDESTPNILVLGPGDLSMQEQQASLQWRQRQQAGTQQYSKAYLKRQAQSDTSSTFSGFSSAHSSDIEGSESGLGGGHRSKSVSSTSTIMKEDVRTNGTRPDSLTDAPEDPRLTCLKLLIVKAAMNIGYQRPSASPPPTTTAMTTSLGTATSTIPTDTDNVTTAVMDARASSAGKQQPTLAAFVRSVPSNSFGIKPWQIQVLASYKRLVATDPTFRDPFVTIRHLDKGTTSSQPSTDTDSTVTTATQAATPRTAISVSVRRARAVDVARSVTWLVASQPQYLWLRDLFRWVFGFYLDEGERRPDVVIQN